MTTERITAESLSTQHVSLDTAETHPRPSVVEAQERSHMRRALDDDTQRKIWLAFYAGMALLIVIGLAVGLGQRADSGEALPEPAPATR
jgi:hypothetical protein